MDSRMNIFQWEKLKKNSFFTQKLCVYSDSASFITINASALFIYSECEIISLKFNFFFLSTIVDFTTGIRLNYFFFSWTLITFNDKIILNIQFSFNVLTQPPIEKCLYFTNCETPSKYFRPQS